VLGLFAVVRSAPPRDGNESVRRRPRCSCRLRPSGWAPARSVEWNVRRGGVGGQAGGPTAAEGLASVRCCAVADSLPATNPGLVDLISGVLAENGPMAQDQLAAVLAGRGVDLGDVPDEALDEALSDGDGLVAMLADDRWASLPALLAGRVFTHRMTGPEVEHDILQVNPDLEPVAMLTECEQYQRLADSAPGGLVVAQPGKLEVGADPGQQVVRGKWLGQVVVCASGEAFGDGLFSGAG
jgi:hypothetical protein